MIINTQKEAVFRRQPLFLYAKTAWTTCNKLQCYDESWDLKRKDYGKKYDVFKFLNDNDFR